MKVFINGLDTGVPAGTTISTLLGIIGEPEASDMIIEINHRFIPTQDYEVTCLQDGDSIEVIHLAMGG